MMTVKQLLPATPRIWAVTPDTPLAEATALMAAQGLESLLVLDGGVLRGLLTAHDCATTPGHMSTLAPVQRLPVGAVMRRNLRPVRPEESLAACAQQMAAAQQHHLPVMEADRPLGIVSLEAVTAALVKRLAEQEFLVTQLENYITGRRA
ncbi:MAG: CBS domain-containing protein [Chloroflexales bacterium]|nr:CBS domain-containing protein [Chloroflexales bacterium]